MLVLITSILAPLHMSSQQQFSLHLLMWISCLSLNISLQEGGKKGLQLSGLRELQSDEVEQPLA